MFDLFSPDHFIDYTNIRLDDSYHFRAHIFVHIVGHRDTRLSIFNQFYGHIDTLEEAFGVNATEHEATFVKGFGTLGAGADTHGRERMALTGEEAGFFRKCTRVGYHAKGVHLEAIVVMEAKGLMLDDALIKLESACL